MPTLWRIGAALDHLISCNDIVQRHMVNVVTNQIFYWFCEGRWGDGLGGIVFILPKIRREISYCFGKPMPEPFD